MMDIAVIGAGLAGCTVARILANKGYKVDVYEKDVVPGGLAQTMKDSLGRLYEPYGNHTFHTENEAVWKFITSFGEFSNYFHRKGIMIDGECYSYPLQYHDIAEKFPKNMSQQILEELSIISRGDVIVAPANNFEATVHNMIGISLYELIIREYTQAQWSINPRHLSAEWAPKRIGIRYGGDDRLFRDEYQGVPKGGFTAICHNMLYHANIKFHPLREINHIELEVFLDRYKVIFSSAPLDEIIYDTKDLAYRGATFVFDFDVNSQITWENYKYGTINFTHGKALRKINFGVIHNLTENIIGVLPKYVRSAAIDMMGSSLHGPIALHIPSDKGRMYPVHTKRQESKFASYLSEAMVMGLIPIGRQGAFRYFNMDEVIKTSMQATELIEDWPKMQAYDRMEAWKKIYGR